MNEQKILELLSKVNDIGSDKKLSDILSISGISQSDQLLKIRFVIKNIDSIKKQQYRKLIEETLSQGGIESLVSIVTEEETPKKAQTPPQSNPAVKTFLPDTIIKRFKKIIAVYSTKGGVGKSTVASKLALDLAKRGMKTAIVDLDIYGPSVPRLLGMRDKVKIEGEKFYPATVCENLHMMSVGLLIPDIETPLIWRAPIVNGVISQIFSDTVWADEYEVLILDMPPGTGDIPILAGQSLSIDGILAVSTPQGVALEDTIKGLAMFKKFNIPILGLVYNMGSVICTDCNKTIPIYPHNEEFDEFMMNYEIDIVANLPLDPTITKLADKGELIQISEEDVWQQEFNKIVDKMIERCIKS